MYKLDLPVDLKEKAAIDRRRQLEKERQARIFNNKNRLIGVDKNALEQQISDKNYINEMEKKRNEAFAHDMIRNDKISILLQKRQDHDEREINKSLNEFRALHQQPDGRREWDLQDPDHLKKEKPARVCDEDPRCGPASLQKFDGEDLNSNSRKKYQQEQIREWTYQQIEEKNNSMMQQKLADKLYDFKQIELDKRSKELQNAEEECRRAINTAVKDYNDALSREIAQRNSLKKNQEQDDNMTEIANALFSDMLTENPQQAISNLGPNRVVPDRWKGMSEEQIESIRKKQLEQIEERKRIDEQIQHENREWDKRRIIEAKAGIIIEKQKEEETKELLKKLNEENKRLEYEQKSHQLFLNKTLYTNQPTAAYFMQFNTSSR